jgi:hypothetical protein
MLYGQHGVIGPAYPTTPDERARALLFRYLTAEQKYQYLYGGKFGEGAFNRGNVIITAQSGKQYIVNHQQCFELIQHALGPTCGVGRHYCAFPERVPWDDVLLAKILALKYREKHFLAVAK